VATLHKDLHDLLEKQNEAGARIEKLEAADWVMPADLRRQIDTGLALIDVLKTRRDTRSCGNAGCPK